MSRIAEAVAGVRERVAAAAERSGRDASAVTLVAVSKGVGVDAVLEAAACGVSDFGENRAAELRGKADALRGKGLRWHFLGAIQTNKVRALDDAVLIHGLDRIREGEALQARGERLGRAYDVLVEVNIAGEAAKQGVDPGGAGELVAGLAELPRVRTRGLMFMAPRVENVEDVRGLFARARSLRDRMSDFGLVELSMGMSDDFAIAVEEGSTMVRIGRAIFGDRPAPGARGDI